MLIPLVKNYIKEHSMESLSIISWVSRQSLHNLVNKRKPTFRKQTLDKLYSFFHLYKDEFYIQNFKRQYQDWPSYLARILQNKRLWLGLSRHELARRSLISEKTISRVERWWMPDDWTLNSLIPALWFNDQEKQEIINFSKQLRVLVNLHKKYAI